MHPADEVFVFRELSRANVKDIVELAGTGPSGTADAV